jgi:hypothetical protein
MSKQMSEQERGRLAELFRAKGSQPEVGIDLPWGMALAEIDRLQPTMKYQIMFCEDARSDEKIREDVIEIAADSYFTHNKRGISRNINVRDDHREIVEAIKTELGKYGVLKTADLSGKRGAQKTLLIDVRQRVMAQRRGRGVDRREIEAGLKRATLQRICKRYGL